ncbi:MAG: plasmid stabilization protein [Calditrichota bacterium]
MASITIRKLPDEIKEKLRVIAAQKGISLEAHLRNVLEKAAGEETSPDIVGIAKKYFGSKNGIDLEIPPMTSKRKPVKFDE